jgi:hypothetical protein
MGVVCFAPKEPDCEEAGASCQRIVEAINASGRAYLTLTELHGGRAMRLGLGNILTTEEHLRAVWEMIVEKL